MTDAQPATCGDAAPRGAAPCMRPVGHDGWHRAGDVEWRPLAGVADMADAFGSTMPAPEPFDYLGAAAHDECDPACPHHVPRPWPPHRPPVTPSR